MKCPKCDSENVAVVASNVMRCHYCEHYFLALDNPAPELSAEQPAHDSTKHEQALAAQRRLQALRHLEAVKLLAFNFALAASISAAVGGIILLVAIYNSISGEGAGCGYLVAGLFVACALWLFLITQVIHIRANTSKD